MAQQVNIVYLLLCHLNRHFWFELPGIGIFNASVSETYIDHIDKKIHPARLIVDFISANALRAETMIENLSGETGIDASMLEEHLAALCGRISDELNQNGEFVFQPFGIMKNIAGILNFQQSDHNIHQDFYWMEPIPITPVTLTKNEQIIPPVITAGSAKSRREFAFLLSALTVLWIIFLGLLFCPHKPEEKKIFPPEDTAKEIPVDTAIEIADSIPVADTLRLDTSTTTPDTSNPMPVETVIDSSNIDSLNHEIKYRPCVIILGSFQKLKYADKLEADLKTDGFEVYRGEYKNFHRVGISFNCFEYDLKQMLDNLKTKYNPEAWILKY